MADEAIPTSRLVDTFVSIVAVVDASTPSLDLFLHETSAVLAGSYTNYELVLVDNGLLPEQLILLRGLLDSIPCVRVIRLSKRLPRDGAIFAGLEMAIGDFVCVLTPGYDPPGVIPEIVGRNLNGEDIVQGISQRRADEGLLPRLGRRWFYWYNRRFLDVTIPENATDLISMSRRVINSLTSSVRNHRYLRHLVRHVGYALTEFSYSPMESGTRHGHSIGGGVARAVEMVSSYSTHPLRFVTYVGVAASLVNLLYAVYVVIVNVISTTVPGWTTTSLQLSAMFALIFIILAVLSEYMGRILAESRREPPYFVMEELESTSLITERDRRNVTN